MSSKQDLSKCERLKEPGTYDVMILNPHWEETGKPGTLCAVLPGVTEDNKMIEERVYFSKTIVQRGKNQGKALWEISAQALIDLGMPAPFNPADIDKLEGACCEYVVESETYEGKTRLVVKYMNPRKRAPMPTDQAASLWAEITGGASPTPAAAPATTKAAVDLDDDLPFGNK
jgi:hypothetical protein